MIAGLQLAAENRLVALGDWTAFAGRALSGVRRLRYSDAISTAVTIGVGSVAVVCVSGLFIGFVLAVQAYAQFHQIGLDTSLGAVIHMGVVRELGPVLTAVMLAGRIGSALAAELGTMKVTEQLDALACLGVDPVKYLTAPRVLACILTAPVLTIFADIAGVFGSSVMCLGVYGIEPHHYWEHTKSHVGLWDVFIGLFKAACFGGATGLIACHQGFRAVAGAKGVGRAATRSFVISFLAILAIDLVLAILANTLTLALWTPSAAKVA
jgi:phospholipid/cholesterol/gamma-HCH transport system permease protein